MEKKSKVFEILIGKKRQIELKRIQEDSDRKAKRIQEESKRRAKKIQEDYAIIKEREKIDISLEKEIAKAKFEEEIEKRKFIEKCKVKCIRVKGLESLMELNEESDGDEEAYNTAKKKLK